MPRSEFDERLAAARAYEQLHVPALFRQWTPWTLDAARVGPGERVLDVACGTGLVAREAAIRVGPAGFVAGVDVAPGMLETAKSLTPGVDWREGAAESLPYDDASFDAVVCQFGLALFGDRLRAVRQMVRVAVPGGRIAVTAWAALDESPAYPVLVDLLERLAGRRAADALRVPFELGSEQDLTALLEYGGAADIRIVQHVGTARFPNVRTMVEADLRGRLPVMGVNLTHALIQRIVIEANRALDAFVRPDGRVVFDAPGYVAVGTKA